MGGFTAWATAARQRGVLLGLFMLLALVPFAAQWLGEPFYITLGARILVYALAAMALNLILGFAGLVSFGHAMFIGLGCYSVGILSHYGFDSGWLQLLVCIAVCVVVALLVGSVCLRTTGIGFIMITLAFAQMFYFLTISLREYGGDDGLNIYEASRFDVAGLHLFDLDGSLAVYWAAWILLLIASMVLLRLRRSPFGMMLRATHANPRRVDALGYSVFGLRLTAYVASGVLTGIAGLLLANLTAFASPSYMAWTVSGELIFMAVIGGLGNVLGPLFGAAVYMLMEEGFKSLTMHWMLLMGPVIVVIAMLAKTGYGNVWGRVFGRMSALGPQDRSQDKPGHFAESAQANTAQVGNVEGIDDTRLQTAVAPVSLKTQNLSRSFGGLKATDGVSLDIPAGQLHALIGPNGAGKTTLINLLSGELQADGGVVQLGGQDVSPLSVQQRVMQGMLRSYQVTSVFDHYSVLDNVCMASLRKRRTHLSPWPALTDLQDVVAVARTALHACRLDSVRDARVDSLAYGQRRQLEIAMALAGEPSVLLLDEPMAGMSASESANVIALLQSLKGRYTIVLVEHDMNAVFALADRISVLVYGKVIATGTAQEIRNHPDVRRAYLGDDAHA